MSTIGTLFVDEQPIPIRRIFLRDGLIFVEAVIPGPLTLPHDSEVRIHDPEGNLVTVAPWTMSRRDAKHAAAARGGFVTIELPISITVSNWPKRRVS